MTGSGCAESDGGADTMDTRRAVLITGCSSGIGLRAAELLAQRGYRVFASARKRTDVEALRARGLEAVELDLDDSGSIRAALEQVLNRTGGRLYGLFNNGGYGQPGAVEDLSRAALRAQFETNLFGWIELTNHAIRAMRAQGEGRIVMNGSVLGLVALPYRGAYNAAKFALEGITDTLRLELRGSGIHVALIEPGPITSRFRANAFAKYREYIDAEHSAHREIYRRMERRLTHEGAVAPFTLPPDAVVCKLIHALESPRPRARYYVTVPTWFFGVLRRFASTNLLDAVLRRISRGEHRR